MKRYSKHSEMMYRTDYGDWVKYDDIKHLLREPTFTLPQKKKTNKRWIDDQRYKSRPGTSDCDGCDLIAKRAWHGACPYVLDCDKDHIIWKLAMPKSHPLDLDNLPKGFTGERWLVEYSKNGNDWFKCIWDRKDQIEIDTMRLWIQYGTEYRYTKKAPK